MMKETTIGGNFMPKSYSARKYTDLKEKRSTRKEFVERFENVKKVGELTIIVEYIYGLSEKVFIIPKRFFALCRSTVCFQY